MSITCIILDEYDGKVVKWNVCCRMLSKFLIGFYVSILMSFNMYAKSTIHELQLSRKFKENNLPKK